MSRDINAGERFGHGDLRDGRQYLSRPVRAQIESVNPTDGKLTINTNEVYSTRSLTAPVLWFSAQGRESAWGRYMPMGSKKTTINGKDVVYGGEICHVLYRNDGTAVFAGYDATATKDGEQGWTDLEAARQAKVPGFSTFRQLKRGEFDFKSSGDAYIFGSNAGQLLLAGGQAYIKLDKQAYRIESKAAEFHQTSLASQSRVGIVFRKLTPADMSESQVPGGFSEFLVDLNNSTTNPINPLTGWPTNPLASIAKLHFGDIYSGSSPPIPMPGLKVPGPLRGLISLGGPLGAAEVFRIEIDQAGNAAWTQVGPLGIDFTTLKFSITSPMILLGGVTAIHPLILSTPYRSAESAMHTAMSTAFKALATAAATAPLTPLAASFTTLAAALDAFETGAPTYLSPISKTA